VVVRFIPLPCSTGAPRWLAKSPIQNARPEPLWQSREKLRFAGMTLRAERCVQHEPWNKSNKRMSQLSTVNKDLAGSAAAADSRVGAGIADRPALTRCRRRGPERTQAHDLEGRRDATERRLESDRASQTGQARARHVDRFGVEIEIPQTTSMKVECLC